MKGILVDTALWPLAQLYRVGVAARNTLFDLRLARQFQPHVPVISVGNLSAGGTGKTPHVEYLIRHLTPEHKIAVISRGYRRQTRGFRYLSMESTAQEVGDEPLQIYRKFAPTIISAVSEKRVEALRQIMQDHPDVSLFLLDDAFQHRWVQPHLNIALTDYSLPFWKDTLLPVGRLREPRKRIRRADIVIVTKCPLGINDDEKLDIIRHIRRYAGRSPRIYFTGVRHGMPKPGLPTIPVALPGHHVTLVTGIAHTGLIAEYVATQFNLVSHLRLRDHYQYTAMDLGSLLNTSLKPEGHFFLTTEKDLVKWTQQGLIEKLEGKPVYYLPFEICFLDREAQFLEQVRRVASPDGE